MEAKESEEVEEMTKEVWGCDTTVGFSSAKKPLEFGRPALGESWEETREVESREETKGNFGRERKKEFKSCYKEGTKSWYPLIQKNMWFVIALLSSLVY